MNHWSYLLLIICGASLFIFCNEVTIAFKLDKDGGNIPNRIISGFMMVGWMLAVIGFLEVYLIGKEQCEK